MKRVVTGHNEQGKSVFVEVAEPDHVVEAPGMTWREIWATFPDTKVPLNPDYKAEHKSRWTSIFPAVGSTRVRIVQFDPDNAEADFTEAAIQRTQSELPGLMEHMEPGTEGMHTTDSVDYGILLEGTMRLELDDGEVVDLEAGDVVVQNGTRHAWHYTSKCTIAWILIGVPREDTEEE